MSTIKQLLDIKKAKKAQQPAFLRRNFKKNKRSRVTGEWRAPKGLHNKLRRRRRGIGQWVMPGYRMPRAVRGMTRDGLVPVLIENKAQLEAVKPEKHILIIKAGMGKKKRMDLIKAAMEQRLNIANINEPALWLKNAEEELSQRKKAAKEKKHETKPAEKVAEKKADKLKEKIEDKNAEKSETNEKTAEEIAKEEKKEQEKILTKRE